MIDIEINYFWRYYRPQFFRHLRHHFKVYPAHLAFHKGCYPIPSRPLRYKPANHRYFCLVYPVVQHRLPGVDQLDLYAEERYDTPFAE